MENLPAVRSPIPSEHEMTVFNVMSKQAVESKMYKGIGDQAGVMMIMLSARELGISPMQAINGGLNIIQGKVEISARMMGAMIRRAGHDYVVKETTETSCTIFGKRGDTGREQEATFTIAEAQKAGLVKPGGGWTKWPKDMLYARALSRLARQLFSDVIGIGYVEGEIKATECEVLSVEDTKEVDDYCREYLRLFDPEDFPWAMKYLKVVQDHFEWTVIQAIQELLKDPAKLAEKFKSWKEKQKLTEAA